MIFYEKIAKGINKFVTGTYPNIMPLKHGSILDLVKQKLVTIENTVNIHAENVVDYVGRNDYEYLQNNMLTNHIICPPYTNMYIEFGNVFKTYANINKAEERNIKTASLTFSSIFSTHLTFHEIDESEFTEEMRKVVHNYDIKWTLEIRYFVQFVDRDKRSSIYVITKVVMISSKGKIVPNYHNATKEEFDKLDETMQIFNKIATSCNIITIETPITNPSSNCTHEDDSRFFNLFKGLVDNADDELTHFVNYLIWMTLTLMHCKNVSLPKRDLCEGVSNRQRKKIQRSNIPIIEYHVIEIQPIRKNMPKHNNHKTRIDPTTFTIKSDRICRGHFKNYAEGSGLFGKFHGMYWWGEQGASKDTFIDYNLKL